MERKMHRFPADDHCARVPATFKFINGDDFTTVKPYYYGGRLQPGQEHLRTNLTYNRVAGIEVSNVRSIKESFDLEAHGIQFFRATGAVEELPSTSEALNDYLAALAEWIRQSLGADKVIVYDYAFRRSVLETGKPEVTTALGSTVLETAQPAEIPHVDQTRENGLRRAMRHLTDSEREKYLNSSNKRIRILNVWRPLSPVVDNWPLAFCDPSTVCADDLIRVDRLRPTYAGEVYYLQHTPAQRWYYLGQQTSAEITVFSGFDTHPGEGPP
ncbi:hypothetical protein B0T16DRAFT_493667, partial [Cercophora newfieldiana]